MSVSPLSRVGLPLRLLVGVVVLVVGLLPSVGLAADDPYRPQQWALDRIGAERAWQASGGGGAVVAVIDSGVDLQHPDLAPNLLRDGAGRLVGRDFVDGDARPQDEHGHGTMVAGVAAAVAGNGQGIAGSAPSARIMPVRVLDEAGRGTSRGVDRAIRWAVDHGADVINLSLEGDTATAGADTEAVRAPVEAVVYAWERGVAVVAASGNTGDASTDYPAGSPVLVVGATTRDNAVAGFSDAGRRDAVVAPGVDIVSTWCHDDGRGCDGRTHTYGQATGTSFAAPLVSGAIAVLKGSGMPAEQAVEQLRATARDVGAPGRDPVSGHGLIDLSAAVGQGATSLSAAPAERPSEPAPRRTVEREEPEPVQLRQAAPAGAAPTDSPPPPGPRRPTPTEALTATADQLGAEAGGTTGLVLLGGLAIVLGLGLWGALRSRGFR